MSDLGRHDLAAVLIDTGEQGRASDKSSRLRLYTATVLSIAGTMLTVDFGDGNPVSDVPVWSGAPAVGENVQVLGAPGRFLALGAKGVGGSMNISTDPGNQASLGSDGGVFVPRIVTYADLKNGPA